MDLALSNLQRLICHETQQSNQPAKEKKVDFLSKAKKTNGNSVDIKQSHPS